MSEKKLLRLSRVRSQKDIDTVAYAKRTAGSRRAFDILQQAENHWMNMWRFRQDRERNKKYCYGEQWSDIVNVDGENMSEEKYLKSQGSVPLKNNLIRRLVRNVLGVYRSQAKEPVCTARDRDEQSMGETITTLLQYNMQLNKKSELDARTMEEFLISGFVVHRKWFGWRNDRLDCWTDYVQPNNFIIDCNMRDMRGWDVSLVGEIHDIDAGTLESMFAKSPAELERLRQIYAVARNKNVAVSVWNEFGYDIVPNSSFLNPLDDSRCRVFEIWRKEQKPRYRCHDWNTGEIYKIDVEDYGAMVYAENQDRMRRGAAQGIPADDIPLIEAEWFIDDYWYYYFISPMGDILEEGESPYAHKSHPYVFKAYPFIDGEIHSFVADVIDQQRYTNRLITMYDWIMRASAKGVLMVPRQVVEGSGMSPEEFADEWTRFNGVIFYNAKPGIEMPKQIANNSTNIGISELLNLQLKFFEDISGVNGALQGKPGYSSTSGALYAQQTQNATTSLLDILDSFSSFIKDGAYKDVKNIQQFYDDKRILDIAGRKSARMKIKPDKVRDAEVDLSIEESTATPAYRQAANEFLIKVWEANQISLEQLLEHGDFPFADSLLQGIRTQNEQGAGLPTQGIPANVIQQAQQGANMDAVNRAYNLMTQPQAQAA